MSTIEKNVSAVKVKGEKRGDREEKEELIYIITCNVYVILHFV